MSLLIFLLAMGIWVRSYFGVDDIFQMAWLPPGLSVQRQGARCSRGLVYVYHVRFDSAVGSSDAGWFHGFWSRAVSYPFASAPTFIGFGVTHRPCSEGVPGELWELQFPLWLFLLLAIPPLLWVWSWRLNRGRGFPVTVTEPPEATT